MTLALQFGHLARELRDSVGRRRQREKEGRKVRKKIIRENPPSFR